MYMFKEPPQSYRLQCPKSQKKEQRKKKRKEKKKAGFYTALRGLPFFLP